MPHLSISARITSRWHWVFIWLHQCIMTSSNGNLFHVTDVLWGKSTGDGFPSQRPVTRNFSVFFDLRLNDWAHNRDAGDLRRHRVNDDVTVMDSDKTLEDVGKSTSTQPQQYPTDGLYILADTVGSQQNPTGHLFIKQQGVPSSDHLKYQNCEMDLNLLDHSEIWQAPRQ